MATRKKLFTDVWLCVYDKRYKQFMLTAGTTLKTLKHLYLSELMKRPKEHVFLKYSVWYGDVASKELTVKMGKFGRYKIITNTIDNYRIRHSQVNGLNDYNYKSKGTKIIENY